MRYVLVTAIALALALPTTAGFAATSAGQSVSSLGAGGVELVAKKKTKKAKKGSKSKVAKK